MTAPPIADFIAKWGPGGAGHGLNERQGAQQHFIELCAVLEVAPPSGANDGRDDYLFEKGTRALGQQRGFADVFKRGCFAWEYKAPGKPLEPALRQLMMYALALDNPPLLVVSDRLRIEIHTHFNGTPSVRHVVALEELGDPARRELLRRCFEAPERFRPAITNRQITEDAAHAFATTAERLREGGVAAESVSHFLTQCLFCFFAEDVGLLPGRLFERLVGNRAADAATLRQGLAALFGAMRDGGLFGADAIAWFNGGLFQHIDVPELGAHDVAALRNAAGLDWSAIDPSIFGTLFERGLDPKKRSQLGAHYTDPATIMRLVEPVVVRPLKIEWERTKRVIARHIAKHKRSGDSEYRKANDAFVAYLEKLRGFRVLDPACGSGNFLYLALKSLKDIEHQANLEAEALGLQRQVDAYTSPANMLGIELNEYAAELARVTVWIGELQWRLQHGYPFKVNPVLDPLDQIECRDALMNADGSEAAWPQVSVVIGNPPFVGDKKMRSELGDSYTDRLRAAYAGRVPGGADLVTYWFEKARAGIESNGLGAAGLVATNSIRGGKNREVLDRLCGSTRIFEAWSDEPWVNEGAAVRVSLVCFGLGAMASLNGRPALLIHSDLSAGDTAALGHSDTSKAKPLDENAGCAFQGPTKGGHFELHGDFAREMLKTPATGDGSAADVVKRWFNGDAITTRWHDMWIIDFGSRAISESRLFDGPFKYVIQHVKPDRDTSREKGMRERFWLFKRSGADMKAAVEALPRVLVTPEVSKHRLLAWLPKGTALDKNLVAFARADDTFMGVLQSRIHSVWALKLGTSLEDRPRYTSSTTFRTFPFPAGLTPADTAHQRTEVVVDLDVRGPHPNPLPGGEGAGPGVTAGGGTGVDADADRDPKADARPLIPADLPATVRPHAEAIARAAKRLDDLRERWLNPPEWTRRESEVVPLGMARSPYPDRILAREGFEKQLAARTLTKLYNERPAWLAAAHEALDAAVAAAYGWADYTPQMSDEEILRRLLALNRERSGSA